MTQAFLPNPIKLTMRCSTFILLLSILLVSFEMTAQKPANKAKYTGVGLNIDKIELLYQDIEYTRTSSSGRTYGGRYQLPLIRINGAEPVDVETDKLLPFFKQCPSARKELMAYQSTRKKGKEQFIKGFLLGGAVGVAGLLGGVAAGQKNEKLTLPIFAVGFGSGVGLMINGAVKSRKNQKKSEKHLENTVAFYNQKCYQGPTAQVTDSVPSAGQPSTATQPAPALKSGVVPRHRDTVMYELLRNDPAGMHMLSLGLHLTDVDIANFHGFNYWVGADFLYQKTAKFSVEGLFRTALVDNLSAESSKGGYGMEDNREIETGEAADYKRAREMSMTATVEIFHRNRERKEEVSLGTKRMGGAQVHHLGHVTATQRVSWCLRAGAVDFRSVWFNLNGLPFRSSPREIINQETGETHFGGVDLSESLAMVHSTSLTVGLSRRVVSDLNIKLLNNASWKGRRKNRGFSEIYADAVYAPRIKTGEVYQVRGEDPNTGELEFGTFDTDGTPLAKLGWRAGFRSVYESGFTLGLEIGQRPGPNESRGYLMFSGQYRLGKSLRKL